MADRGAPTTVAFVDLAGFTALTEIHGDADAVHTLERFETAAQASLRKRDRLVKTIGDALMLAFEDPPAAMAMVIRLFGACRAEADFPVLRAGLHHGPVTARSGDLFGGTVNLAARVTGVARGGEIVCTASVLPAARETGLPIQELGKVRVRNLSAPVELYSIDPCPADHEAVIDPVCRMQVDPVAAAGQLNYEGSAFWFCSLACAARFSSEPGLYRPER